MKRIEQHPTCTLHPIVLTIALVMLSLAGCQLTDRNKPFTFSDGSASLTSDTSRISDSTNHAASSNQTGISRLAAVSKPSTPVSPAESGGPNSDAPYGDDQYTDKQPSATLPGSSSPAVVPASTVGLPASDGNLPVGTSTIRGQLGDLPTPVPTYPGYGTPPPPAVTGQSPFNGPSYQAPPQNNIYDTPPSMQSGNGGSAYGSSPSSSYGYGSTLAPGASNVPYSPDSAVAPGVLPTPGPGFDDLDITAPDTTMYRPNERIAPIDIFVQEARTGSVILGGAVNSDLGVSGQLIIQERNFDIRRVPRSWSDMWSGRAFRGGGQNFRAELMPGTQVQRYTVTWTEPHLRNLPYSLSVGGFLYSRQFRDWTEQRLGGRVALGYEITKDLSISTELRLEDVKISDPRLAGVQDLDDALGSNDIYRGRFRLAHDTRDNPFMSTQGGLTELIFDQVFGEYDYQRAQLNLNRYLKMRERADGGGRHTLASTWQFGITGAQTPIFENFYAGGYSTMRGFSFRGASPKVGDVQVGGEFMFLGSLEYVFPVTADEMLRAVAFVDYGTVERDLEIDFDNFRIAPGFGLRIAVPALGPAPLAFDFAFPVNYADSDDRQIFSFFMGLTRS